jgi:hypothetical protein
MNSLAATTPCAAQERSHIHCMMLQPLLVNPHPRAQRPPAYWMPKNVESHMTWTPDTLRAVNNHL